MLGETAFLSRKGPVDYVLKKILGSTLDGLDGHALNNSWGLGDHAQIENFILII